jgi:hypothetical protein
MKYVMFNIDNGCFDEINEKFIFKSHLNFEGITHEELLNFHYDVAKVCNDMK